MKLLKILSQKNRFRRQKTLEDRNRRNNLRFDGFQEETNETREESESIVTDFVKEKLSQLKEHIVRGRCREMMGQEIEREQSL